MRCGAGRRLRESARRARREVAILVPLLAGVLLVYTHRRSLFGADEPVRVASAVALLLLGWWFARDMGQALAPLLFGRLEPATAGVARFLVPPLFVGVGVVG